MSKKTIFNILKYVLGLGVGLLLLYLALSGVELTEVKTALKEADYTWVGAGVVLALLSHWFRAARWKMLYRAAGYESNTLNLFAATMIGYMVNQAVPRAGEISRVTLASRTEKIPLGVSFGTVVTDRIFDVVILAALIFGVVITQLDEISMIMDKIFATVPAEGAAQESGGGLLKWIILGVGVLGIALFVIFRKKIYANKYGQKLQGFLKETWSSVKSVRKMNQPLMFVVYTIGIWICYVLMTYLVFFALEGSADLSFVFALTVFTMGGIGIVIPSPGGIGTYHFAVIMTFVAYAPQLGMTEEVARTLGTNIAFIIHTSQLIMMIVVGFLCYLFLIPRLRVANEEEAAAGAPDAQPAEA
ncbi:MAG: lysylphosphatidylglycerol synthase transmembrane domain-containing protein [Bacteroidota bacterium]